MEHPIFIGGVPRSGTTLLRVMLDSHSRIHCGTEMRVLPALADLWRVASLTAQPLLSAYYQVDETRLAAIYADLIRGFLAPAWRKSGKPRPAEKTPWNLRVFAGLGRLFPQAKFIHIVRDGRDVVASRLQCDTRTGMPMDPALAAQRALEWVEGMEIARHLRADHCLAGRYFELRYEQLVAEPQCELERLCVFLDECFEPAMLDFHRVDRNVDGAEEWSALAVRQPVFASSVGRHASDLDERQRAAVLKVAGPMLSELGYLERSRLTCVA